MLSSVVVIYRPSISTNDNHSTADSLCYLIYNIYCVICIQICIYIHGSIISGEESVLTGIIKHLVNTLKEKERHGETLSARWLFTESSKTENINSAGTFRYYIYYIM